MRFREIFLAVAAGLLVISKAEQFCIKPTNQCTMHTCFDYTKCPINGDFKVFFYDKSHEHGHYKTDDPNEACLFVYQYKNETNLSQLLPYWNGGTNHLVVINDQYVKNVDLTDHDYFGRAMIAGSQIFDHFKARIEYEIPIPKANHEVGQAQDLWEKLSPLLPIERTHELIISPLEKGDLRQQSTFVLILIKEQPIWLVHQHLMEALETSTIPIFVCFDCQSLISMLPFNEVLDWSRAALFIPKARYDSGTLTLVLESVSINDRYNLKKQGRFFWLQYLGSTPTILQTTLNLIRTRIGFLPAFNPSNQIESRNQGTKEPRNQGTKEPRNQGTKKYEIWNDRYLEPFMSVPSPFEGPLPTEAKVLPAINGVPFKKHLAGNRPYEQFTLVIQTYKRAEVLRKSLEHYIGLQDLDKILVIINSDPGPYQYLHDLDLGVPIICVQAEQNSLNNRFLPYDEIETDAVLSFDDDMRLTHDEINLAFRIWRQERQRLVGFAGRFHIWHPKLQQWYYGMHYSCQMSMTLTNAVFYHKYYMYAYSFWMPQAIRNRVDELMNCEDIAMNFLISHIAKEPPIKVGLRHGIPCYDCPATLSNQPQHYEERTECLNYFSQVFGYNPLLYTQFRAASLQEPNREKGIKEACFEEAKFNIR